LSQQLCGELSPTHKVFQKCWAEASSFYFMHFARSLKQFEGELGEIWPAKLPTIAVDVCVPNAIDIVP